MSKAKAKKEIGRPSKYKSTYPDLILSDEFRGLHLVQVAAKLGVSKYTFYDWEKLHPDFGVALDIARTARYAKLFDDYDANVTTSKDERFSEKANIEYLRYSGFGRRLTKLNGVKDEFLALQIVQDALANDEIVSEYAESLARVINTKREARLTNEIAAKVAKICEQLGIKDA